MCRSACVLITKLFLVTVTPAKEYWFNNSYKWFENNAVII